MRPTGAFHPVRLLYLAYYARRLDWASYKRLLVYFNKLTGRSKFSIVMRSVVDSLTHNVSPIEFFQFGFPRLEVDDKKNWAGSGFMYEFQRVMNPPVTRNVLDDKRQFFKSYRKFFKHNVFSLEELESDTSAFDSLRDAGKEKVVLKVSDGKCGAQVGFVDAAALSRSELLSEMRRGGYDMAEEFVAQHEDLQLLSPSAVNTVRIITQLNQKNEVEILGCRLRISVDSAVDNLAAGNIAAPIDEASGLVSGPAVYGDVIKPKEAVHPITETKIVGFQVPFWSECLQLAKDAANHDRSNRSIGWDIVVTDDGPGLIEGNHDWCKLVWQLPVETGLRPLLLRHWDEYIERDRQN
jgi:hypothetical protein